MSLRGGVRSFRETGLLPVVRHPVVILVFQAADGETVNHGDRRPFESTGIERGYGCLALVGRPVSQLSKTVPSPGLDRAVRVHDVAAQVTGLHVANACQGLETSRVAVPTHASESIVDASPLPGGALPVTRQAVLVARGNPVHVLDAHDLLRVGRPPDDGAASEFAVVVLPPRPHSAVAAQRQAVLRAGLDIERIRRAGNNHGSLALYERAVAELSLGVGTPGMHPAAGTSRHAVRAARRDGADVAQPGDLRWRPHIVRRSVTKLPVAVPSPGPNRPVGLQCQAVASPGRDLDHVSDPTDAHGRQVFVRGTVPELAVCIHPPGSHGTVRFQDQAVESSRRNPDRPAYAENRHRRFPLFCRPVPQLPVRVPAPRHALVQGPAGLLHVHVDGSYVRRGRAVGHPEREGVVATVTVGRREDPDGARSRQAAVRRQRNDGVGQSVTVHVHGREADARRPGVGGRDVCVEYHGSIVDLVHGHGDRGRIGVELAVVHPERERIRSVEVVAGRVREIGSGTGERSVFRLFEDRVRQRIFFRVRSPQHDVRDRVLRSDNRRVGCHGKSVGVPEQDRSGYLLRGDSRPGIADFKFPEGFESEEGDGDRVLAGLEPGNARALLGHMPPVVVHDLPRADVELAAVS